MADKDDRDTSLSGRSAQSGASRSTAGKGGATPSGKSGGQSGAAQSGTSGKSSGSTPSGGVGKSTSSGKSTQSARSDTPSISRTGSSLGGGGGIGKSTSSGKSTSAGPGRGVSPGGPSISAARTTTSSIPSNFNASRFGERYGIPSISAATKRDVNPVTSMAMVASPTYNDTIRSLMAKSPARAAQDVRDITGPVFGGLDMATRPSLETARTVTQTTAPPSIPATGRDRFGPKSPARAAQDVRDITGPVFGSPAPATRSITAPAATSPNLIEFSAGGLAPVCR